MVGFRFLDCDAGQHQFADLSCAENAVHFSQFDARVDAEQLGRIFDLHRGYAVAGATQDPDDIGQVVFVRWIVGPDLEQVPPQQIGLETINPGVEKRKVKLVGRGGLLLHDSSNVAVIV